MSELAQLLVPAIRWDAHSGFDGGRAAADRALELGVGGFIIFGGTARAVRALTTDLVARSRIPLLIGADLERGAGQQFAGATGLPPAAALGWLNDVEAIRRAARLTAREARALGVNWIYGPVCDLDVLPANPIVGTRAFGSDERKVAHAVSEWVDACQHEGVLACAKHFPGHGRTLVDSHATLPEVNASRDTLMQHDLPPFAAAIDAGVASVMSAHVVYPSLDEARSPATLSRSILHDLLRRKLGFEGLVVTDALIMDAVLAGRSEGEAAVRAVAAGCDMLLYPQNVEGVLRSLDRALRDGELDAEAVRASLMRRNRWAEWGRNAHARGDTGEDMDWAAAAAERVVHVVRGSPGRITSPVDVVVVDDDLGGPYPPPSRQPFVAALESAGWDVRVVERFSTDARRSAVLCLYGDIRGWKNRAGYSETSRSAVARALVGTPQALVAQFSHPRLASELPESAHAVCAWGGEAVMQEAAARWIVRGGR